MYKPLITKIGFMSSVRWGGGGRVGCLSVVCPIQTCGVSRKILFYSAQIPGKRFYHFNFGLFTMRRHPFFIARGTLEKYEWG